RHLLEQPSPHAARLLGGDRVDPVGEPASAFLAVALPRDDGLDGPDSLRAGSGCPLRRRAADGGGGVLAVATNHHPLAGTRLAPQPGSGPRLEGQALAPLLSARHRAV